MNLKQKIRSNQLTIGSWISIGHPAIAEIMTKSSFDWLAVDLEHSVITIKEAEELIRIIELSGISPLVRLTENNDSLIKRIMDAGSHGIIVPMIKSLEEARSAINSAYYPPKGNRSFGLARAQGYGTTFKSYVDKNQTDTVVVVQIEHIDALRELKEILSLEEVDAFMIGPYDLSGSMGIPGEFDNKEYLKVVEEINKIGKETGTPNGIHIVEPDPVLFEEAANNFKFIAYSVDFRMIDVTCKTGIASLDRQ